MSLIAQLDALVAGFLAGWNVWSTIIFTSILVVLAHGLFFAKEEDIHPYFLARQASESPVRRKNESATYRNLDTPHGYPLRRGLDIKDPGAPKWTAGRSGDLRDIWLSFCRGAGNGNGKSSDAGEIYTVLGRFVQTHPADEITRQIGIIGKQLTTGDRSGGTVVVCLTNSVELLATVFASAFYGFKVVLVPSNLSAESLGDTLRDAGAITLVAEAGSVDLLALLDHARDLRNAIWVARGGSDDVDWTEAPNIRHKLNVTTWAQLMKEGSASGSAESLPSQDDVTPPSLTTLWTKSDGSGILVEYSQQNLVSGAAGIAAALTKRQRLTSSDTVLIVGPLSRPYPLAVLFAALYSNSSVALGSVAGNKINLALASEVVSPTVIAAPSEAMQEFYTKYLSPSAGILSKVGCFIRQLSLDRGVFPARGGLTRISSLALAPSVRLLMLSERCDQDEGSHKSTLTPRVVSSLRALLGVRVVGALTVPYVFGAVSQTNPFDYRSGTSVHFGPPVSSLELKLVDGKQAVAEETVSEGNIHVHGPAVVGGDRDLGVRGRINEDFTVSLA